MLNTDQMGLTVGLSSAGVALWVRKRVREQLSETEPVHSLTQRLQNRGTFALAGLAFSGCATLVSGTIDTVKQLLDVPHPSVGHAPPLLGGVYLAARLAKRADFAAVRWACDRVGIEKTVDPIVDALDDLASWVLDGGMVGAVMLDGGYLPTMGVGRTVLRLLAPITNKAFNFGLISAASKALNGVALKVGAALAAVSWASIGAHIVSPELPEKTIGKAIKSLGTWVRNGEVQDIRTKAKAIVQKIEARLRIALATTHGRVSKMWQVASQFTLDLRDSFGTHRSFGAGIPPV